MTCTGRRLSLPDCMLYTRGQAISAEGRSTYPDPTGTRRCAVHGKGKRWKDVQIKSLTEDLQERASSVRVNPPRTSMPHVRRRCITRHSRGQGCISWQYRSEKRRVLHVESLVCTIPPSPADSTTLAPPPHTHRPRSTLTSTPPHQRCVVR